MPSGVYKRTKKRGGWKLSEDFKKKKSESCLWKGKKRPEYIGEKISLAKKGKSNGRLGYKHSEETKKKIGESNRKALKGNTPWNKGKKGLVNVSEETRKKQSISMKKTIRSGGHTCWKGGISKENTLERNGIEGKLWREAIFKRDNWTCQKCGKSGGKLNAHHIYNFSEHKNLRFAIDNGITLCKVDHKEFHKIYGKENNTKEQLIEWLLNK